jgi:hypothetical protein
MVQAAKIFFVRVGKAMKRLIRARLSTWHQRCRMSPDRFAWLKMRRTFTGGVFLWVVATAAAVMANTAAAGNKVELDSFSVHLFLEDSGALSRDITKITDFHSWNFKSDEGKADAILIKIRFRSDGEAFAKGEQSKVIVTTQAKKHDGSNRIITSERLKDIYVGPQGNSYRAIFVPDIGCTPLKVTVTEGRKTLTEKLDFACGE